MRKLIKVTDDDIRFGRRASASFCPVARAVNRIIKPPVTVTPDHITVYLDDEQKYLTIPNNERVSDFIRDFDAGKKVKPLNFYINLEKSREKN